MSNDNPSPIFGLDKEDDTLYGLMPEPPALDYERAARTMYEGFRDSRTETSTGILVDGIPDVLPWRVDLYNHSPTGLEWGYLGSGPHQLALAILAHATKDDPYASAMHWEYARTVTSRQARSVFQITGTEVLKWVEEHPITREKRFNFLPRELQAELIDRTIVTEYRSECCNAICDYLGEGEPQQRKVYAVCSECGGRYEF